MSQSAGAGLTEAVSALLKEKLLLISFGPWFIAPSKVLVRKDITGFCLVFICFFLFLNSDALVLIHLMFVHILSKYTMYVWIALH